MVLMTRLVPSEPALVMPVVRVASMSGHQVWMVVASQWSSGRSEAAQRCRNGAGVGGVFAVRLGASDGEQVFFGVPCGHDRGAERCGEGVEGVDVLAGHAGGGAGQSVTHPPFWVAGAARGARAGSLLSGADLGDHPVGHLREVEVVDDQHRVGQDLLHAALNTVHMSIATA
jgi:hypothetical protein